MRAIAPHVSEYSWALPVLLVLGLAAAFVDGLSVSLVVLFLYVVLGQASQAMEPGGLIGAVFGYTQTLIGPSSGALGLLIFALILLRTLLKIAYDLLTEWVRNMVSEKMRLLVHAQFLDVSYDYIQSHDQSDLMNVLGKESWAVMNAYFNVTRIAINACSIAVFGAFVVAASWQIALMAGVGGLVIFLLMQRFSGVLRRQSELSIEVNNRLFQKMLTTVQAMRTLRAFGREDQIKDEFRMSSNIVRDRFVRVAAIYTLIMPIGSVGHVALLGAIVAASGPLGVPSSVAFTAIALLYRLQPQIQELQGMWLKLAGMEPGLRLVRSVLETSDKTYLPQGTAPFQRLASEIRFEGVTVSYPDSTQPSLESASFTIPSGKLTALVGPSGSGKTTIVNLLLRLYAPDSGSILVDGLPLFDVRRADWLRKVSVAGQDAELVEGTVIENIRMGRELSLDACRDAAALAGIRDFIDTLPEGFDTWIGERGLNLSGGQRQRVGLARALAGDPDILILDEATNALDSELERRVLSGIRQHFSGRTLITITHHMEAMDSVDQVIQLRDGRVVETRREAFAA